MLDLLSLSFESLGERKLRASLTILGIVIGSSLIVALISETQGLSQGITEQINKLGSTTIIVRSASSSFKITNVEVSRIGRVEGVSKVLPIITRSVTLASGGRSERVSLIGVDSMALADVMPGLETSEGSLVPPYDLTGMVLGYNVVNPAGSTTPFARLNQPVTVEYTEVDEGKPVAVKRAFRVAGLLQQFGASAFVSVDDSAMISVSKASSLFKTGGVFDGLIVVATNPETVPSVTDAIAAIYGDDVLVIAAQQIIEVIGTITSTIQLFLGIIAGVALVVSGVGIANIMFVSVYERRREIGVLKSIGFKNLQVMAVFLGEAALIGAIGGVAGLATGTLVSYTLPLLLAGFQSPQISPSTARSLARATQGQSLGSSQMQMGSFAITPVITPELLLFTLAFSVAISMLAGLYPAWRASRLDPVEALRAE